MTTREGQQRERTSILRAITRDLVLFTTGLGLTIFEAVVRTAPERTSLLVMYAGMMGLPAILRADQLRRNGNGNGNGRREDR